VRLTRTVLRILFSLSLAGLIIIFLPHGVTNSDAAGGFVLDTHVNYQVNGTTTQVSEQYTVTNQTPRQFLTQISLTTPVSTISGVSARYSDGGNIPVASSPQTSNQSGISYNYQNLTLNFPRQIYGQDRTWSFTVTYSATGLVEAHGGAHTVYVPAVQADSDQGDYTVRVDVPSSFGTAHFQGPMASQITTSNDRQDLDFNKTALVGHSLALSFGDESIYSVNFNFPLSNPGLVTQTEEVTLPPNLNNQQVHIQSLDPEPVNTHVDADGNILADYRVAPGQHITVKTVVVGQVNYLDYNLAASGKASAIPPDLVKQYTGATQYWQTGGQVGAVAKSLDNPNAPVIDNVRAMYNYVVQHLTYNPNKIKFNIRQGSTKALADPTNVVCLEYSDLLIAMLRSQGIPARMPIGYGYSGNLKASASVVDSLHSWVEAYVPGIGWMTLDPTWGEKFDLFGQSDLDHFAFAVWGSKDQLPAPVMINGQDTGYQYEQTTLSYIDSLQTVPNGGKISLTRRPLLPFVSLDELKVSATGDQPGAYTAQHDGQNVSLGTLAPGQHVTKYKIVFGKRWKTAGVIDLIETGKTQSLVVARATTKLIYRPLEAAAGFLLLGLALVIVLRLRLRKAKNRPTERPHL